MGVRVRKAGGGDVGRCGEAAEVGRVGFWVGLGWVFFSSRRRHTRYWRDWSSDVCSSDLMASYARHLIHAGAKILGGCCGTTPEHIKAIVEGIRPLVPRTRWRATGDPGSGTGSDRKSVV